MRYHAIDLGHKRRRAFVCVVLGAITTITIAWGSVYRSYARNVIPTSSERGVVGAHVWYEHEFWGATFAQRRSLLTDLMGSSWIEIPQSVDPSETVLTHLRAHDRTTQLVVAGWPFAALKGWIVKDKLSLSVDPATIPEQPIGLVFLPRRPMSHLDLLGMDPGLPARPMVTGFIANSALYSLIWGLPMFGFPMLKRWLRKRRGRCPACAYDLNHDLPSGCPECGWQRDPCSGLADS